MLNIKGFFLSAMTIILLSGCSEALSDIKSAVSGINTAATNAATAISQDVHTLRAVEVHYQNETFTINDLFKSILRDVQWHYEQIDTSDILKVTGTWQEPLFKDEDFDEQTKKLLKETGIVTVILSFNDGKLLMNDTTIKMELNGKTIVEEQGEIALTKFYDSFIQ